MTIILTWGFAAILTGSFAVCALLVATQRWHGRLTLDHDVQGVQKLHQYPVPRIGGLGCAIGLMIGALISLTLGGATDQLVAQILLCALPAFIAGLTEDLTKKVSVKTRLYASFASAALASWVAGIYLTRLDTPGLDMVVATVPTAVLVTCIAVGGVTHAINLIDGLNGLAAGCVVIMLAGLAAIAWQVGDTTVLKLCIWGIAALSGFLALNFPFGRIFLGDGGAYLAGFWVAQCGLLLLKRNPSVSTWAVLLCCLYPVWETLFSMYRRHLVDKVSSGKPDMTHLHHLIYRRVTNKTARRGLPNWARHGLSSASIWLIALACALAASLWYDETATLMALTLLFIFGYGWLYQTLSPSHRRLQSKAETILPDRLT